MAVGLLLDACPPPLRQTLRERGIPHRRRDAAADRAALSGRKDRARQGGVRAPGCPARTFGAHRRRAQALARGPALAHPAEIATGRGYPLYAGALARPDPLPR